MPQACRSLLLALCSLLLLPGCGSSTYSGSRGTISNPGSGTGNTGGGPPGNPPGGSGGPTGTNNSVVATPSVTAASVVVGAKQTVSITFTSSDGRAISGFGLSGTSSGLPAGWSGPGSFTCASVSTGSGCVLNLIYAPLAVASGTLTVNYVFVDNASMPRTGGSLSVAYVATKHNNAVAAASPIGQVNAIVGGGNQSVSVNFTTDDGNPAANLVLTTDLGTLPSGWNSTTTSFSCPVVSTGNGCQLPLTFAPTAAAHGTLTLNYAYADFAGTAKTGSVNVAYAATTNDNAVATVFPTGQINAVAPSGTQAVVVAFTTDDGLSATAFQLTSSLTTLPAGWSSTAPSFSCSGFSSGNGCQLSLMYAPQVAGSGTLVLSYAYVNNAGEPKTGSTNIAYRATMNDNIVGTPSPTSLAVSTGSSTPVTVTFTTDDGNPATGLSVTSSLGALPGGWTSTSGSLACSTVSTGNGCQLSLRYAPTSVAGGTLSLNYSYVSDSGTAKTGSVSIPYAAALPHLYVAQLSGTLLYCSLHNDGTLSSCAQTGGNLFNQPSGIAFYGDNFAYVADSANNAVYLCNVAVGGSLSGCVSTGANFQNPWLLAVSGQTLYATNASSTGGVTTCAISTDGTLSSCTQSTGGSGTTGIAVNSTYAYFGVDASTVDVCAVGVSGILSGCTITGSGFSSPLGISLSNGYAYIANQGAGTASACAVNADGTLSSCTAYTIGVNSAPTDVVINGNQAYVNDVASGNIYLCAVGAGGALASCVPEGGTTFNAGIQIAVH
jgi:hypothetical protein